VLAVRATDVVRYVRMALTLVMFFFIVFLMVRASGLNGYRGLLRRGVPARGILLAVAPLPSGSMGTGLAKLQTRRVTIDVERAGEPPYEVTGDVAIPLNLVRDILPGATVELRVARKNRGKLLVVGPGVGFNSAALRTQGQINQGAA
jgi:hypothetical protein